MMQPKESKTNKHFVYSMTKSTMRLIACVFIAYYNFIGAAFFLAIAEGLGIAEEF